MNHLIHILKSIFLFSLHRDGSHNYYSAYQNYTIVRFLLWLAGDRCYRYRLELLHLHNSKHTGAQVTFI